MIKVWSNLTKLLSAYLRIFDFEQFFWNQESLRIFDFEQFFWNHWWFQKNCSKSKIRRYADKSLVKIDQTFNTVPSYFWFWTVFLKPRMVSTIFFFLGKILKHYLLKFDGFMGKFWPKITNEWFHRKHAHVLFYFCWRSSVKLGQKNGGIHVLLWR